MFGHFYYDKFKDGYLLTNDAGYHCFLTTKEFTEFISNNMQTDSGIYQILLDRHFCFSGSKEAFIRECIDEVRTENSYLFEPTTLFIFAVTNECNNRCVYCQANGTGPLCKMTNDVADNALRKIAESPAKELTIEFQGGEPLLNFPVIRYIVEKAEEYLSDKKVHFTLVSNLALMTEDIARFLLEHHVSVSTSLDGSQKLHDKNRPASDHSSSYANMIKGKAILEKAGIKTGAIQTTTAFSLQYPEEIVRTYAELGYSQIFIRPLTRLGAAAKSWDRIGYTPEQYLAFYKRTLEEIIRVNMNGLNMTEYHAALLLSKILSGRAVNYMELRSPCGAGLGQIAFTANGNVYTCDEGRMIAETGDEAFLLGNVYDSHYDDWINSSCCKAVCSASLLDTLPGCCDCVYKPYCGVCPVVNYAINGSITQVSKDRCAIYKGILDILFEYIYDGNEYVMDLFQKWSGSV